MIIWYVGDEVLVHNGGEPDITGFIVETDAENEISIVEHKAELEDGATVMETIVVPYSDLTRIG